MEFPSQRPHFASQRAGIGSLNPGVPVKSEEFLLLNPNVPTWKGNVLVLKTNVPIRKANVLVPKGNVPTWKGNIPLPKANVLVICEDGLVLVVRGQDLGFRRVVGVRIQGLGVWLGFRILGPASRLIYN